jgi:2,4-dienoyl-CoA reductase-like NADH-dependent reductase (Old Yellow Enzyme family)/thioredoxin reductase
MSAPSTSRTFPRLFSPLQIGPVELPNRIVSSGHDTVMSKDGLVTDQLVAYHEARARGGTGCIVVQVAGVHESARYTSHVLMATDDGCIPGYRRLAEAVKPHGTVLFGQLFHPGREVMETSDGTAPVAVAPSAVPTERFRVMPRPLRDHEIAAIVDGYGAAAQRLLRAGLDGVEVVASHGYLPAQFLNPHVNRRTDDYGGSVERRRRFLREVLVSVRHAIGGNGALGVRVSLGDRDPAGLDATSAAEAIVALARETLVDYVSVTTGTSATLAGSDHIVPEMGFPNGYVAPAAAALREALEIPVVVAGRINQPQEAERILETGQADACAMTRALICDPELPARAARGQVEDIRACIACNQACIGHFHMGYPISCIQHPETGRELRFGIVRRARRSKSVIVVGAGPAGMKAAAAAASRGHQVRLYEAAGRVGGQVLLAQRLPGREEFGGAADNLLREVLRAGVHPVLHHRTDADFLARAAPDMVIVATGARPYRPLLEIRGEPWIADATSVVTTPRAAPKGHLLVVDGRGDWIGIGVARLLAERGRRVTLAVSGYAAGEALQQYVRDAQLAALERQRIVVLPLVRLFGVDDDTAYLQHVLTEEPVLVEAVQGVVLAHGQEPEDQLLTELFKRGLPAIGVGDCLAPRSVEEAVLEGLVAATAL